MSVTLNRTISKSGIVQTNRRPTIVAQVDVGLDINRLAVEIIPYSTVKTSGDACQPSQTFGRRDIDIACSGGYNRNIQFS